MGLGLHLHQVQAHLAKIIILKPSSYHEHSLNSAVTKRKFKLSFHHLCYPIVDGAGGGLGTVVVAVWMKLEYDSRLEGGDSSSSSCGLLGVPEATFGALVDRTGDVGIAERCEGGLEQPCVDGNGHHEGSRGSVQKTPLPWWLVQTSA